MIPKTIRSLLFAWLPVLVWMVAISWVSGDSNPYRVLPLQQTRTPVPSGASIQVESVAETSLPGVLKPQPTPTFSYPVRTAEQTREVETIGDIAHWLEFTVLAFLVVRAFAASGLPRRVIPWIYGGLLCVAFALVDEIHQVFVPGRRFQIQDLLIDLLGILTGLAVYRWCLSRRIGETIRQWWLAVHR